MQQLVHVGKKDSFQQEVNRTWKYFVVPIISRSTGGILIILSTVRRFKIVQNFLLFHFCSTYLFIIYLHDATAV